MPALFKFKGIKNVDIDVRKAELAKAEAAAAAQRQTEIS